MSDRRARGLARALLFAACSALLALAPSCTRHEGPASPRATEGRAAGALEIVVASEAETLDPRYATDTVGVRVTRLVHAGLVRIDPDTLDPVPYAARGWRWLDPLTLRVELRPGARFHSGAELRAADVVATLRAFGSSAVGARLSRVVEPIASAEEDGANAVVIRLKRAHATLLTDLELPILRADEASGPARPDGSLDGLGPYVVTRSSPGEVELAPRSTGLLPEPAHGLVVRTVRDGNARALRLIGGRSDIVPNGISPPLLPALGREPGVAVVTRPGANLTYLVPRVDRPPLDDPKLREAISLAVDRAGLVSGMLAGYAHVASGLLPPGHWAHVEAPPFAYDAAAARALLAPRALHLTLLTSTDRTRATIARAIAQELGDAGALVDVVPLELGTMIARLNAGDFDLAVLEIPELVEPNVLRIFLHSTSIPPAGANRGRVRDPELDRLFDEGDAALDREARRAVYGRLEEREREMLYLVPLWHEDQVAALGPRASAFRPSAEGRWLAAASLP